MRCNVPDLLESIINYKDEKIAVYGLGAATKQILPQLCPHFQVIGLLDSYRTEGELYGLRILSLELAVKEGIKLILVAARPGSCKAIAGKIGETCKARGIALMDIRGNDLCREKKTAYHFRGIDGLTKEQLRRMMADYDVISVDLFDTLVMRQVLFPTDIFTLVEYRLKDKGYSMEGFCGKRLESEKYMSRLSAPTLTEIYEYLIKTYDFTGMPAEELAALEYAVDCETLVPRKELCRLLGEAGRQGKEIYLVSDTFYRKEQVEGILKQCGIDFYTDIFASCEYGTGKTGMLFDRLKEQIRGKSCLHMGDDLLADVESAKKKGLSGCLIYSGMELMDLTGYLGLWNRMNPFSSRLRAGMLAARLFNSPFQFETEERTISVQTARDAGYLFFAPMISDFVLWFEEQVRRCGIPNIWFCARDGYLIKRLYDELAGENPSLYFLTSRTAAVRAGMECREDAEYVGEMKFSGTLQQQLKDRFGVETDEPLMGKSLPDCLGMLLERSVRCRENYKKYIAELKVQEGDIAFFDFVAKGTSQMYVGRLVNNHCRGFYFLQLEREHMKGKGLDICSFYQKEETEDSAIFDNYYILEVMLTSPEPSVEEFDEEGNAVYGEETRKKEDIRCILDVQEGIYEYFRTYLKLCPKEERETDKQEDEIFLSLIHKICILDQDFLNLTVEDPFFNRRTAVTDLI